MSLRDRIDRAPSNSGNGGGNNNNHSQKRLLDRIEGGGSSAGSHLANRIGPAPAASRPAQSSALKRDRGSESGSGNKRQRQDTDSSRQTKPDDSKKQMAATRQSQQSKQPPKTAPLPQKPKNIPAAQAAQPQQQPIQPLKQPTPPKEVAEVATEVEIEAAQEVAKEAPKEPTKEVKPPAIEQNPDVHTEEVVEPQHSLYDNLAIKLNEIINKNLDMKRLENDLIETFEQKQSIKTAFGSNLVGTSSTNYQKDLHKFDLHISQLEHSISAAGKLADGLAGKLLGELLSHLNKMGGGTGTNESNNYATKYVKLSDFNDFREFTSYELGSITSNHDLSSKSTDMKNSIDALKDGFRNTRDDIFDRIKKGIDGLEEYTIRELREMDSKMQKLNSKADHANDAASRVVHVSNNLTRSHTKSTKELNDVTDSLRTEIQRLDGLYAEESKRNEDMINAQNQRIDALTSRNEELQQSQLGIKISLNETKRQFTSLQNQIHAMSRQPTQFAQPAQPVRPTQPVIVSARSATPNPNHYSHTVPGRGRGAIRGRGGVQRQSVPPQSLQPYDLKQQVKPRLSAPTVAGNRPVTPHSEPQPQAQPIMQQNINKNDTHGRPLPPHLQKGFNHNPNW